MKPIIIIQARTGSSRLPGKTLLPFYGERGILEILVDRIRAELGDATVVVATTTNPADDAIEELCRRRGFDFFRGNELDVLSRFIGAAEKYGADKLIRICSDNLFLDVKELKRLADWYADEADADYASFSTFEGKPMILTHYGLWAIEACKLSALKRAADSTSEKLYHEHVTNYLYTHPEEFSLRFLTEKSEIQRNQKLRLTIDTPEDFKMMQAVYSVLAERNLEITPTNIVSVIDETPEYYDAMESIINQNKK